MSVAATVGQGRAVPLAIAPTRLGILMLLCAALAVAGLALGPVPLSPVHVLGALFGVGAPDQVATAIVWEIRLPRVALGLGVGATLAIAGASLQAIFRNPLADPTLLGVSTSAGAAAVAAIVLGSGLGGFIIYAMPLAAFAGALTAATLVYAVARKDGEARVMTMLLAGIAINAMAAAITGLFLFLSDDRELRAFTFWQLGSLAGATWATILPALVLMVAPLLAVPFAIRGLNLILLGEREAGSLGLDVEAFKRGTIVLCALSIGAGVAVAGAIGFVGLVAPHLVRMWLGPDHRLLVPASALLGSIIILAADLTARLIAAPAELPIGVVTAFLGAPFFLWLLRRASGREGWS